MRKKQNSENAIRFWTIGLVMLAIIFLTPDAGKANNESFFAVACQSKWHHPLDWPAIWCSIKIILLSVALLLIVDATIVSIIRSRHKSEGLIQLFNLLLWSMLGCFGFYEMAKAIL